MTFVRVCSGDYKGKIEMPFSDGLGLMMESVLNKRTFPEEALFPKLMILWSYFDSDFLEFRTHTAIIPKIIFKSLSSL